jgi:hypothetical protein
MKIVFYHKDGEKYFAMIDAESSLIFKTNIWLENQDGEGGDFNLDEVSDVIYNALDKYFKENH